MFLPALTRTSTAPVVVEYRIKDIPLEMIRKCTDDSGEIADIDGAWNPIRCEIGGHAIRVLQYTGKKATANKWDIHASHLNLDKCP
ncbi:hypothetical protein D3C87_1994930 [compost metagenome]